MKLIDLSGRRVGRLTVLEYVGDTRWKCLCDCGKIAIIRGVCLRRKDFTQSCGCFRVDTFQTHGLSTSREWRAWHTAKQRCFNPKNPKYPRYGGRGITMCDEWKDDFAAFINYIGPRPSPAYSLDRYPNYDGNYAPGNVRWATVKEQRINQANTHLLTFNGETLTIAEWAARIGMNISTLHSRITRYHWPVEKALTKKIHTQFSP